MEFKKNRQTVILEALRAMRPPDWTGFELPVFLRQSKQSQGIAASRKRIDAMSKGLRTRVDRVLRDPARYDVVHKSAQWSAP
jgi:hypothetical protein